MWSFHIVEISYFGFLRIAVALCEAEGVRGRGALPNGRGGSVTGCAVKMPAAASAGLKQDSAIAPAQVDEGSWLLRRGSFSKSWVTPGCARSGWGGWGTF